MSLETPTKTRLRAVADGLRAAFGIILQYPVLIPLGLVTLFAQMTYSGINNVALPVYLGSMHLPSEGRVIGTLTSTFLLAETFLRVPFGWLSDRIGRTAVIIGAMLLSVPSVLCAALAPGYLWLYPLRGWDGMMAAALWPSVYALIGDRVPERVRANAMGVVNMMYMLALFLGGAFGFAMANKTDNPRAFFFLGAAIFLIGGVLAAAFFRNRKQYETVSSEAQAEEAECPPVTLEHHLVLLTITFTQTFAITALAPFMIRYATDPIAKGGLGFGMTELALLVGAPIIGIGIFALPLSRLSDAMGKVNAVRLAFTAIAIMLWIFASYQSLPVLALTATIIGVAFSMGIPAWLAILSNLSGCKSRGVTMAGYGTIQGIASVVGPLVSGYVWDTLGHGRIFMVSAAAVSLAALLAWAVLRDRPQVASSLNIPETV